MLVNYLQSAHFRKNKFILKRCVFDIVDPAPAPDTAPSGQAIEIRYSVTVYYLSVFTPSP
jgi:hypothetical protein